MNLQRRLIIKGLIFSPLLLINCDTQKITGDITIKKENKGEITGVVYRVNKDEKAEGVYGVGVERRGPDYEGGIPPSTTTASGGIYSFSNVVVGSHSLKAQSIKYHPYEVWEGHAGVAVTKGNVSNVDIVLKLITK